MTLAPEPCRMSLAELGAAHARQMRAIARQWTAEQLCGRGFAPVGVDALLARADIEAEG